MIDDLKLKVLLIKKQFIVADAILNTLEVFN